MSKDFRISDLPENLMISFKFFLSWYELHGMYIDELKDRGLKGDKNAHKVVRELYIATLSGLCLRRHQYRAFRKKKLTRCTYYGEFCFQNPGYVSKVKKEPPDAITQFSYHEPALVKAMSGDENNTALFHIDEYKVEITEYEEHSLNVEDVLKKKLVRRYNPETNTIICYTERRVGALKQLSGFVRSNNPHKLDVCLLQQVDASHYQLITLDTHKFIFTQHALRPLDIDINKEKSYGGPDDFRIDEGRRYSGKGTIKNLGTSRLLPS